MPGPSEKRGGGKPAFVPWRLRPETLCRAVYSSFGEVEIQKKQRAYPFDCHQ
jgi:hypothetical protein